MQDNFEMGDIVCIRSARLGKADSDVLWMTVGMVDFPFATCYWSFEGAVKSASIPFNVLAKP